MTVYTFSRGFFGTPQGSSSSSSSSGGFVGAYTTAVVAAGANNNILPVGAGWPGTVLAPYGRVDFTGAVAAWNITGLVAGLDGQIAVFRNATNFNGTFNDQNAGSVAANRFAIGDGTGLNDTIFTPGMSLTAYYYAGTINRWILTL